MLQLQTLIFRQMVTLQKLLEDDETFWFDKRKSNIENQNEVGKERSFRGFSQKSSRSTAIFSLDSEYRFIFVFCLLSWFLLCFISFLLTISDVTSLLSLPGRSVDPRVIHGIETGGPAESKAVGKFGEDRGKSQTSDER